MRVTSQRHPLTAVTISSSRLSHFRLGLALRRGLGPLAALDWNFLPDCEICEVVWWLQTWTGTKWIFSRCMNCMNSVWRCEESRWMYQEAWSTSRKLRTKGSLKLNTLPLAILSTAFNYSYKGIWPHQVCCIVGGGQMGMAQNGYVEKMSHIIGYYWILIVLLFLSCFMGEWTIILSMLASTQTLAERGAFVHCGVPWGGWSLAEWDYPSVSFADLSWQRKCPICMRNYLGKGRHWFPTTRLASRG